MTLTGVGGTGKTRLAVHVARKVRRAFTDGVWLVELADLRDPALLGETVASTLGLSDVSNRDPERMLADYVADKQLLLVLDNCEHLVIACARLVAVLLVNAPGLRVLVTSRAPLEVGGERVWPVEPLSLPPEGRAPGDDQPYEALTLFEQRAADVVPGFAVTDGNKAAVTRLCRRLDGLPLAIELAAARLRILDVDDLLARVEDRFQLLTHGGRAAPARHQTLRAAIEWSFELCTELERVVWARLSVFPGEFDLAAAEEVCACDGVVAEDVFTGIAGLVGKSLLTKRDEGSVARYRMLDTIREYGSEQLGEEKKKLFRRRHRDFYLRLAERAEAAWFGPCQAQWLERFYAERPNVRVALEFCRTEPGEARTGLRMAGALYWYWGVRAVRDGRWSLDKALASDTAPSPERATALWALGWITAAQGDIARALAVLSDSCDLAREFGDETTQGHAQLFIGLARWFASDLQGAADAHERAVVHYRNAGAEGPLPIMALGDLGACVGMLGGIERGVRLCQECIAECQTRGERWARSWALFHLSLFCWLQRDLPQATARAREALRLKYPFHDQAGIAWCVQVLGWVAAAEQDVRRAVVLFGIAETLWEHVGGWFGGWDTAGEWSSQYQAEARSTLGGPAYEAGFRQGASFTFDEAVTYALGEHLPTEPVAPAPAPRETPLTRREHEVAALVAQGLSNKDIATALVVARRTVESHVDHILNKLGYTSRAQIAAWITEQR
ncbi:ATP-binding protein [Amycolatopsis pigmentata]|uniref:ATP-binding protein n=1 Tax=Amycolatopsis pigmentata TaxID=450801 RepID=A0ABW5FIM3_9PSEU